MHLPGPKGAVIQPLEAVHKQVKFTFNNFSSMSPVFFIILFVYFFCHNDLPKAWKIKLLTMA